MVKIIAGLKGSGKTKTLIDMVNSAVDTSKGSVVCLEIGEKLRYDVNYNARLVDVSSYGIEGSHDLFGFISGMYASNHDITHVFVDSALKMCRNDVEKFATMFVRSATLAETNGFDLIMTASIETDKLPEEVKSYL
ncbi:MAG: hypothetical protein MJ236_07070 [Clostridia bacterium]|nr:hypothetical protein [Clostridia bacterium]